MEGRKEEQDPIAKEEKKEKDELVKRGIINK